MNSTLTISNCGHEHEQFTREHRDQIFKCGVCKELGNGARYICSHGCTDFHVHTDCVDPPSSLQHPFYPHCQFQFHRDRIRYKRCDACGLDIKGSMYHCSKNRKDLHPCCAKLPLRLGSFIEETETAGHEIPLILCPKLSSKCFECGHKKLRDGNFMSWGYTTECNTIWYHVACAKETLNEIYFMRSANYAPRQGEGNGGRLISRASDVSETLQSVLQSLKKAPVKNKSKNEKMQRLFKMAKNVVKIILAAVIGDFTTLGAGIIVDLIGSITESLVNYLLG